MFTVTLISLLKTEGSWTGYISKDDVIAIVYELSSTSGASDNGLAVGGSVTDLAGASGYYELYTQAKITRLK